MKAWTPKSSDFRAEYNLYKVLGENRGDLVSEAVVLSFILLCAAKEEQVSSEKTCRKMSNGIAL